MKCKRHPFEQGVGVCASCLRERLLALIEAQTKEERLKSDPQPPPPPPPPLSFPRSVSPYICRRRSDAWQQQHHDIQFYSTPQVGATDRRKKKSRFSVFSTLFGASRSGETERDSTAQIASTSSSWFSVFRKKKSRLFSLDDEISGFAGRRSCRPADRGMSPDESPISSRFSWGSSPGWRKSTPVTSVLAAPRRSQHGRNVSGLGLCMSPLVRPSPSRQRHDTGFSDELRIANRHHFSTAASLCANRSRKLADIRRYP